jgi:tetratricopeptide (TPR) repeat protein
VAPLAVPAEGESLGLAALRQLGAVALFVQRGRAVRPDFALDAANAAVVGAICRRLDGLPLALELAAARLKVLPPGALLGKLERRLALLTGGTPDLPERQRTLRDTIAWSYELLRAGEQALFRRLAVFAGGATLEAVEAVCAEAEEPGEVVLDGLGALIDHSLVQVVTAGGMDEPRYSLLETLREYGLEQLEAAGESAIVRRRHLAWCLARAEQAATTPEGPGHRTLVEGLEAERDNLQAALAWCGRKHSGDGGDDRERMLRLATALGPFWEARGPLSVGRRWLETALVSVGQVPFELRLPALAAVGRLAAKQGDPAGAERWFGESLTGCRAVGDRRGMAVALTGLGQVVSLVGETRSDQERACAMFEEALALCQELGDRAGIARALNGLALVARELGDHEEVTALLGESLDLQRGLEDRNGTAETLLRLGECVLDQGDTVRARELFDEHLAEARALGDPTTIASALLSRGEVAMRRGEFAEAEALMAESLALARQVDATLWIGGALHRSGMLAAWQGHFELASVRIGEALTMMRPLLGEDAHFSGARGELAWIESCRGDHDRAVGLAQENLANLRKIGDGCGIASGLTILGGTVYAYGDEVQARAMFQESLGVIPHRRQAWCYKTIVVQDLAGLAWVALSHGQPERSVVLYGASEACRATAPFPLAPPEEEARDRVLTAARAALGAEVHAAAWARGQAMPLDEAIALALEEPCQPDR